MNVQGNQNLSHSHGGRTYSVAETHGSTTTSSGGESSFWTKRAAYRANLLSGWSNTWIETGAGFVSRDLPNGGDDVAGDILHINAHTHTFDHFHYLWGDGGNEARPDNFTYRIWKRIS